MQGKPIFLYSMLIKIMALLQVALDFVNLSRALKVAEEAIKGGADIIEAGTPLIKAEGMNAVRELTKFGKKVVADMKTMDVGDIETEMAAKAGAAIVTVMGNAGDETIREAIEAGKRYGAEIMVDLMECENIEERAKEMEEMGADYVCVHVAIDSQMKGLAPFEELKRVASSVSIPVAVAGGINAEGAKQAVESGAEIVIVGGAIIKAENAMEAARKIKDAMEGVSISSSEFRKYRQDELIHAFKKVSTCNIADAMHNRGAMRGIFPLKEGYKMVGKAITVKTLDGDWAKVVEAIDIAGKDNVIVVEEHGSKAVWGELATESAARKGIAGVVIDGSIRDIHLIKKHSLPVFARSFYPDAGEPLGHGEINVEINCGGQVVKPGDWIVGDDNGIVVVPKEMALKVANRAINVMERENRIREEIRRGKTLASVLELGKWEKVK